MQFAGGFAPLLVLVHCLLLSPFVPSVLHAETSRDTSPDSLACDLDLGQPQVPGCLAYMIVLHNSVRALLQGLTDAPCCTLIRTQPCTSGNQRVKSQGQEPTKRCS
eukprot:1149367-Rhodomonas_salina.5